MKKFLDAAYVHMGSGAESPPAEDIQDVGALPPEAGDFCCF